MFLDESGLLLAPLVRRGWALRGCPPQFKYKAGHREKVSVAAALWLPPRRDRLGLTFQTRINGYFSNVEVAEFLEECVLGLDAPLLLLWDNGGMHTGGPINDLVEQSAGLLERAPLPAHAPELMPVEQVWMWLKFDRLDNFAPRDALHLNEVATTELLAAQKNEPLLRRLWHNSDLPLPRALLS